MGDIANVPLYSSEEVYRPIFEQDSALLEVQIGCSWGRCKFCDFPNDGYRELPLEEIELKAQQLAPHAQERPACSSWVPTPCTTPPSSC